MHYNPQSNYYKEIVTMGEILSVVEIFGNNLGPIGATIVAVVLAVGAVFKFSNIRHFELKSKWFNVSLASKGKTKTKPKAKETEE